MNSKFRDILFFSMCITLMFNCVPKCLQAGALAGPMGMQLSFYPTFIGILYTIYCQFKYKCVLPHFDKFKKFIIIYIVITLASLIHGLYIFPYYELISSGPIEQVDKIPKLLKIFNEYNMNIAAEELLWIWVIARPIKGLFFETIYTFGVSYMVFVWYYCEWEKGFSVVLKAILYSCVIISLYSVVEICFLTGNLDAKYLLENINPYIHLIKINGTWHPPLLWYGQLRSVFAEPSHFGIYSAFVMPFIWYLVIKQETSNKTIYVYRLLVILMTFFIILTKARTAFLLLIGELFLTVVIFILIRDKNYIKKFFVVLLCSVTSFIFGNYYIEYNFVSNKELSKVTTNINVSNINVSNPKNSIDIINTIGNYVESNAGSIANPDKRSNRARFSVMSADFRIGMDNLWLGVGRGLRNAYIPDYFDEKALQNNEVKMWLKFREKLGIMKFSIARLGEYTARFAETGLIGLLIWGTPACILLFNLFKKIYLSYCLNQLKYIIFSVSFVGVMVSGIGDFINLFYSYWILLGLGYAMCFGKSADKLNNEST